MCDPSTSYEDLSAEELHKILWEEIPGDIGRDTRLPTLTFGNGTTGGLKHVPQLFSSDPDKDYNKEQNIEIWRAFLDDKWWDKLVRKESTGIKRMYTNLGYIIFLVKNWNDITAEVIKLYSSPHWTRYQEVAVFDAIVQATVFIFVLSKIPNAPDESNHSNKSSESNHSHEPTKSNEPTESTNPKKSTPEFIEAAMMDIVKEHNKIPIEPLIFVLDAAVRDWGVLNLLYFQLPVIRQHRWRTLKAFEDAPLIKEFIDKNIETLNSTWRWGPGPTLETANYQGTMLVDI